MNHRSEVLFLYDVSWTNPNGDPVDENKPRIDEETGRNIVTDVRLKRTARDYLHDFRGYEIFVREIADEQGAIQDAKHRAEDFLIKDGEKVSKSAVSLPEMKQIICENMLKECIDVRLFGGTIPIEKSNKEKSSITLTGPVQFQIGTSMHQVKLEYLKGTGAFASGEGQTRKTFREEYVLPYSLISFYGVVNEKAAQHTKMSEEDVSALMEGLWNGTKNLISRSKVGQQPRILLRIVYREDCFHIGELHKLVTFRSEKSDEEIRHVNDGVLNGDRLVAKMEKEKEKILRVEYQVDEQVSASHQLDEVCRRLGIEYRELGF
ncbi:type I-B CRISPR-associated protein Cas7/Csh2 [Paludifilum halophilum]|uniref:Type I-B CRISPR-associated protein Cas7/Csh2 n=1 Tax=Paludifilum halophilum TaxID=1642702 RepID=A0A235B2V2_9BACL|nr:type I-B CRISPR-associated protein Cas7/Csh2 [Paludifilum halophilum]OYD06227.1 type I-B CRISPR-associated protein Cas7/Csh2 [Paludifilum halophilum]